MLATNGTITLAAFLYADIQWGNRAQIGFSAGDGNSFFMLNEALTDETLNIDARSNVGKPGVFVFRIDGEMACMQIQSYSKCMTIVMHLCIIMTKLYVSNIIDLSLVECSETVKCTNSTLGLMTAAECCLGNSDGVAYTKPRSEECHVCIGKSIYTECCSYLSNG